ncbi:MAG TPA: ABC transporter [Planctomycetaceae bacterium]|nr:ABC transporter [Planctomycetaceae bacterium]
MNTKVLRAVFKRNFVSYFANPTGYVFICVFVLLSTIAAFWPNEFFNTNLANLDQLSFSPTAPLRSFPFIMLVFIPAITMSIWADERRQGTDELLLTIPAGDLEIVLGKYLAAVAIYSVALLFSLACNYAVLEFLGDPDKGLFLATYLGYWLIGLAMLAIGTVASFLTDNLTIAYILGAVLNAPLVFAVFADSITGRQLALAIKQWSFTEQFRDFGRGIISFSGLVYFLMIVAVMLYVSMILIARRHWVRGRNAYVMTSHYVARGLSLGAAGIALVVFLAHYDVRIDVTAERLSSLSPETVKLLERLKIERPVNVEAFVSPQVPEAYVQTRLNLLSMLRELGKRGGAKVRVRVNNTERFTEEAARAEQRYDITPRRVTTLNRGTFSEDHLFMGVAFTCGLERVIIPFIDRGIPVEYELVRSLVTVTQQQRKKVGVIETDAPLYGRFNMQTMSSSAQWPIIDELEKQYDVERVNASDPIPQGEYDVLLAVQPSTLGPEPMRNFVEAIRNGIPTAIFEDPLPLFASNVPGTTAMRRPPAGMNPMMSQSMEKGDRSALWRLLGVDFSGDPGTPTGGDVQVVWQDYNPYPKLSHLPEEFVFVDTGCGAQQPFNGSLASTAGLQHMLFPFPGWITPLNVSKLTFTPLVRTGTRTGIVDASEVFRMSFFGMGGPLNEYRNQRPTEVPYVLAAHIRGKAPEEPSAGGNGDDDGDESEESGDEDKQAGGGSGPAEMNVVLVADIDMLHREFFRLREQGSIPEAGIHFDFDNVTFVLNVLDMLAGDDRFIRIRSRRPKHRTLTRIEEKTEDARRETARTIEKLREEYRRTEEEEDRKVQEKVDRLRQRLEKQNIPSQEVLIRVAMVREDAERRKQTKLEQLKQKRDREINRIETETSLKIRKLQDTYKMWAVVLPPIPPLVIGVIVFLVRRTREREGVARSRLR